MDKGKKTDKLKYKRYNKKRRSVQPSLVNTVERISTLNDSLEFLNRTRVSDNTHKACVCIICDCFIIGVEKIYWLTTDQIRAKEAYLSVQYFQSTTGKVIPDELRDQYKIDTNEHLSNLLLSPRACEYNGAFMSCSTCYTNIRVKSITKPPRFGISNGWVIGTIPEDVIDGEINDILSAALARVRIFANFYSYSAGAHKAIKGHHVFFVNDPEYVGNSFDLMLRSGVQPDIYVMICGRVTPGQREIIRRRCSINAENYMSILLWLIQNHPSYGGMNLPLTCPQPIFIGGFD